MASIRKVMLQNFLVKSYSDIRPEKRSKDMFVGKTGGCIKKLEFCFIYFGFFHLIQLSMLKIYPWHSMAYMNINYSTFSTMVIVPVLTSAYNPWLNSVTAELWRLSTQTHLKSSFHSSYENLKNPMTNICLSV